MGDNRKKKPAKDKKNKLSPANDQLGENAGEGRAMNNGNKSSK
jgi:hypothetical protein